jgi:hypothetical protein
MASKGFLKAFRAWLELVIALQGFLEAYRTSWNLAQGIFITAELCLELVITLQGFLEAYGISLSLAKGSFYYS